VGQRINHHIHTHTDNTHTCTEHTHIHAGRQTDRHTGKWPDKHKGRQTYYSQTNRQWGQTIRQTYRLADIQIQQPREGNIHTANHNKYRQAETAIRTYRNTTSKSNIHTYTQQTTRIRLTCMPVCSNPGRHIQAYIYRHIQANSYIHTYIHTHIHTGRQPSRHTYRHTVGQAYTNTYIHTER